MKKFRVIGGFEEWHQFSKVYKAQTEEEAWEMAEDELDEESFSDIFELDDIKTDVFEIISVYEIKSD